jgi:hypothetical protein
MFNSVGPAPYMMQQGQQGPVHVYQPGMVQHVQGQPAVTTVHNASHATAAVRQAFHELKAICSIAEDIHKHANEDSTSYYRDPAHNKQLLNQLSQMNISLEDLTIKMSVSHRSLVGDPTFRGELLVTANKILRALQSVKDMKGVDVTTGSCCCTKKIPGGDYLDDAKIKNACLQLQAKVATFKGGEAFKLDLNTTGTVAMTGDTTVNYQADGMSVTESNQDQIVVQQMMAEGYHIGSG